MASGNLQHDAGSSDLVLCDNPEGGMGWEVGGGSGGGWLIHVDIWQKLTRYCKAVIFQLKSKLTKF